MTMNYILCFALGAFVGLMYAAACERESPVVAALTGLAIIASWLVSVLYVAVLVREALFGGQ